jgi:putative ABC transport system permease protein
LRAAASAIDPTAIVDEPQSVADLDRRLAGTRVLTMLLTGFALMTGFLATLGIYGVTAYAVQQRRKEVAIRIALGASDGALVRLFLRNGAMLLGAGTLAGLAGGVGVSRVLRHRIYGVEHFDITTYAAACLGLTAIGMIAMWWPVRQAAIGHTATTLNAN